MSSDPNAKRGLTCLQSSGGRACPRARRGTGPVTRIRIRPSGAYWPCSHCNVTTATFFTDRRLPPVQWLQLQSGAPCQTLGIFARCEALLLSSIKANRRTPLHCYRASQSGEDAEERFNFPPPAPENSTHVYFKVDADHATRPLLWRNGRISRRQHVQTASLC